LGQKQYQLTTSEKELLKKTLKGSVLVLSELLSISNPLAFSSSMRFKVYVTKIASKLELSNLWQYEIAALMSHIGCVTLPKDVLAKVYYNHELTKEEREMYSKHPGVGAKLIEKIPRLENVTKIIARQQMRFDAYTEEITNREPEEVILGAQIMKTVIDFDLHMFHGESRKGALKLLQNDKGAHNPKIIEILDGIEINNKEHIVALNVEELAVGMIVAEDVVASSGELITPRGQSITMSTKQFFKLVGIKDPIKVNIGLVERP
jgi:response regulator RpfG family c-di-GMP phosphodiesterase